MLVGLLSRKWWFLVTSLALVALPSLSVAQKEPPPSFPPSQTESESGDSLAAIARRVKAQKNAHAKKIVTDDDMQATTGPLPRLTMDGAENGEEVIAAIAKYKLTHTPEQTENAVRGWYEEYDEELAAAIKDNLDIKALREANISHGYDLCQQSHDYEKCDSRRTAELTGAREDQIEIKRNNDRVTRIQHSLMNIRNALAQHGLHYDWFKVRTTNNIDRF
jgi:hypothetical protein